MVGESRGKMEEGQEEGQKETIANTKKAFCSDGLRIRIDYLESPKATLERDTKRLDWIEHIQNCTACREFFNFCSQQAAILEVATNGK